MEPRDMLWTAFKESVRRYADQAYKELSSASREADGEAQERSEQSGLEPAKLKELKESLAARWADGDRPPGRSARLLATPSRHP